MVKQLILRIFKKLEYHHMKLVLLVTSFIVMTVLSFFIPIIIRNITDEGMIAKNLQAISIYASLLFVFYTMEQTATLMQTNLYTD